MIASESWTQRSTATKLLIKEEEFLGEMPLVDFLFPPRPTGLRRDTTLCWNPYSVGLRRLPLYNSLISKEENSKNSRYGKYKALSINALQM